MLSYGRQSIDDEDIDAVSRALQSDWLTIGPMVDAFESALSSLSGGHTVVTCTSGTAALHTAYAALGVGKGHEVITSPMTFVATASGASILGAKVVFADIEEDTALIDPHSVDALATDQTQVIVAVDYAGQPADYAALQHIADRVGATTLADAAHSIGGTCGGRPVGDLADVTTYSFFPTKNLTTAEGGAVVSKDPRVGQRAREFHRNGLVRDPDRFKITSEGAWHQEVHEFGVNYRLSDVACALGLSQLKRLPYFKERRARLTARYNDALGEVSNVRIPAQRTDVEPAWHLYPLRIRDGRRREVFDKMRAAGIGVQVNYMPVYWHPVYQGLGYQRGMCPRAERYYSEQLSLPMFPDLTDNEQDFVIETLLGIVG